MTQWNDWIDPQADRVAKKLIISHQIQPGYGMSLFLDVDRSFSNYMAVRAWVQRMYDDGNYDFSEPTEELGLLLTACLTVS